jgi:UDP-N-acetylglucosamine transferase subunit ALG13
VGGPEPKTGVSGGRESAPAVLRVCLAASGGGHIRQLLDLERVWSPHDVFFVTDDTPLSRSIAQKHPVHYVPHFALGQIRNGAVLSMLVSAVASLVRTGALLARERPDVVITTGAGTVFFPVLWARLFGAKIVLIETFARFEGPSWFGRMVAPFAHVKVVQSEGLGHVWRDAAVFNPLRVTDGPAPAKQPLMFVTVGATLPFDRLVQMVADLKARGEIPERVIVQTGAGGATPVGMEVYETLSFDQIKAQLRDADIVVCHAGTGSLITALREGCRVIAVPRLHDRREVYDDHQLEIAQSFSERGLIEVANDTDELAAALTRARRRPRITATLDYVSLIDFLNLRILDWPTTGPSGARRTSLR